MTEGSELIDGEKEVSKWQQGYGEGFDMGMEAGLRISIKFCIDVVEKLNEEREKK